MHCHGIFSTALHYLAGVGNNAGSAWAARGHALSMDLWYAISYIFTYNISYQEAEQR